MTNYFSLATVVLRVISKRYETNTVVMFEGFNIKHTQFTIPDENLKL